MLEEFQLKSCPTVTVMKIISFLLSLAMLGVIILAYYQPPEEYNTVENVKESRAYSALVNASEEIFQDELTQTYENWQTQNFTLNDIAWIYAASLNGYTIYSRIDYTFAGQSKTAYCKTWCGDIRYNHGIRFGIDTDLISENDYSKQNSVFIDSEKKYNDLAISTVLSSLATNISSSADAYHNLVYLFKRYHHFHDATIHSISYTYNYSSSSVNTLPNNSLFEIDYTDVDGERHTEYFSCTLTLQRVTLGSNKRVFSCSNITQSLYDQSRNLYLDNGSTRQGTYGNLVVLSALNESEVGT